MASSVTSYNYSNYSKYAVRTGLVENGKPQYVLSQAGENYISEIANRELAKNKAPKPMNKTLHKYYSASYEKNADELFLTQRKAELGTNLLKLATRDLQSLESTQNVFDKIANVIRRITFVALAPIYLLGAILHAAKTVVKAVIAVPVEIISPNHIFGLQGVKCEVAYAIGALFRAAACFNPKEEASVLDSFLKVVLPLGWEFRVHGNLENVKFLELVPALYNAVFRP